MILHLVILFGRPVAQAVERVAGLFELLENSNLGFDRADQRLLIEIIIGANQITIRREALR